CYVGENLGDDPSEATSKRSGSPLPSYVAGQRWSLRQAARHLLDEPSEEGNDEEEEGSSPGKMDPLPREERALSGNRGSRPIGSAWVACFLGSRIFINWWRSSPSLMSLSSPFPPMFQGLLSTRPSVSSSSYAPFPIMLVILYGPSRLGSSFSAGFSVSTLRSTRSPTWKWRAFTLLL
ncbi:UNVERIFIED_CONTAM: hypothetical protein Slati_1481600, partial [Sesamum latifolium]